MGLLNIPTCHIGMGWIKCKSWECNSVVEHLPCLHVQGPGFNPQHHKTRKQITVLENQIWNAIYHEHHIKTLQSSSAQHQQTNSGVDLSTLVFLKTENLWSQHDVSQCGRFYFYRLPVKVYVKHKWTLWLNVGSTPKIYHYISINIPKKV